MALTGIHYEKINCYGEITQSTYQVGYLNANSSFKVICPTRNMTDRQSGDYMLPPLGSIKISGYSMGSDITLAVEYKYKIHTF